MPPDNWSHLLERPKWEDHLNQEFEATLGNEGRPSIKTIFKGPGGSLALAYRR
jgi:hypothetical protein